MAKSLRSKKAIDFFENQRALQADLIFSDIQLSDGLSFQIFEKYPTNTPVIFTTAYDEYALKAIRGTGIDYLLKPFTKTDLQFAIEKYKSLSKKLANQQGNILQLLNMFQNNKPKFPHFVSYFKNKIIPIDSKDVSCFFIEDQLSFALHNGHKSPLNETLDKIEKRLPESYFFRANRQHIIRREYIESVEHYFNGKLLVKMKRIQTSSIVISKEKSSAFKKWLEW